jgi:hypothetical protein
VLVWMLLAMCTIAPAAMAEATTPDVDSSEGFSVSPLRFDVSTKAGSSSQHKITVENNSNGKLTFNVSKEDVVGNADDPLANPVLTGGKNPSSISGYDWISSLPSSFTLDKGDSKSFWAKVTVPSGAKGGHYAAVLISSAPTRMDSGTASSRAGVLFMMNAGGTPPPEIVIEDVTVTGDDKTVIDYVNEGDTEVTPEATITYVDPVTGQTLGVKKAKDCTTALPGGSGRCEAEVLEDMKPSPSGLVRPEVELSNDGRSAKAALPTEWSGSFASLLLPLIGFGLLGAYVFRRRRRAADADDSLDFVV